MCQQLDKAVIGIDMSVEGLLHEFGGQGLCLTIFSHRNKDYLQVVLDQSVIKTAHHGLSDMQLEAGDGYFL